MVDTISPELKLFLCDSWLNSKTAFEMVAASAIALELTSDMETGMTIMQFVHDFVNGQFSQLANQLMSLQLLIRFFRNDITADGTCVIQHLSTRDELDVLAASAIRRHPDFFLKGPRPSMLKDYFNPKLHKVVPVHRQLKQITIKFQIDEAYVPAL